MEKIKIGISSCLLGNKVRFDGQHKLDRFITGTLGKWCEFIPVCPEVECGMSIPRESLRLVGDPEDPRLLTGKTGVDFTQQMKTWADERLKKLESEDLVAFIFKAKSPSSGLRAVKVYGESGNPVSYHGQGLFAAAFVGYFPDVPVEDEGRLHDPGIRENFIETIFILQRWRELVAGEGPSALVDFHSRHKYIFMAHSPQKQKEMGKIVARAGSGNRSDILDEYRAVLLKALEIQKNRKKNYNVLLHMAGYFRKLISDDERAELLEASEQYYNELVPLIVPLTLFRHYVRKYREPYLELQYYLYPHPFEMGLLNHV